MKPLIRNQDICWRKWVANWYTFQEHTSMPQLKHNGKVGIVENNVEEKQREFP